ncbi:uncharacterized protein EV422DRAFT_566164 [Fimicolochytrium jonesii]|uniref:uncharacterized protein n=1 Tax=Fimicolochytrium jonesii TaxID=1396493 RepID=UPI0022FE9D88|nr:uncharacterized protein EV422DRAFT_566164 [Fimicolochytrium jonesii]KAI8822475.1 hypothetical protein EV422DRAFT_566164 [Fimicolochytrium jonesii]
MAHFGDGEPYFGGGIGAAGTSSLTDLISSLWGSSEPDPTTTQLPYQAPAGLLSILQNFKQPIAPPVTIDTKRPDPAANVDRIEYYTPATPVRTIRTNIPDPVKQTDGVRHETEHNIPATLPRKNVRPATGGSTANSGQREPPPPSFKEVTTGMRFRKLKPSEESNQREFDISKMKADPPTTDLERSNINGDVAREDLGRSSTMQSAERVQMRAAEEVRLIHIVRIAAHLLHAQIIPMRRPDRVHLGIVAIRLNGPKLYHPITRTRRAEGILGVRIPNGNTSFRLVRRFDPASENIATNRPTRLPKCLQLVELVYAKMFEEDWMRETQRRVEAIEASSHLRAVVKAGAQTVARLPVRRRVYSSLSAADGL